MKYLKHICRFITHVARLKECKGLHHRYVTIYAICVALAHGTEAV